MTEGYREGEPCMRCQGRCCRTMGCSLSPEDMIRALQDRPATRENIETLLQECNYAIDSFQNGGHAFYYLRMRHKCFTFIGVDAMGECSMLTEHGCSLSFEDRPKGGRMLEARENGGCEQHYTREMMIADWNPYQDILDSIWKAWHDRMEREGIFDRCEEEYMQFQMARRTGSRGDAVRLT